MIKDDEKLNTIGKAIAIIESIQNADAPLGIQEISETLGLNKSSLHHHIKTMTKKGYLQQIKQTKKYDIGLNLVRAGQSYLQRLDIRERGHHYLGELGRTISETVHLLVLDGREAVYIDKVDVNHQPEALKCSSYIGLRTDVYSTAAGKVLLSHLEKTTLENIINTLQMKQKTPYTNINKTDFREELLNVKKQGYALDLQEHTLGMQCIAVPIFNLHSQCIASVSISCSINVIPKESLEKELLAKLKDTGSKISQAMGFLPEV